MVNEGARDIIEKQSDHLSKIELQPVEQGVNHDRNFTEYEMVPTTY